MAVTAFVSDLLFDSRIAATARLAGVEARVLRSMDQCPPDEALGDGVILDLNLPGDPLSFARELKRRRPDARIVGFLAHVQVELADRARAAGLDEVLPRSEFVKRLPELLRQLAGGPSSVGPPRPTAGK
jgi:DNA-binding NarL/FixJ family response regulator